MKTVGAAMAGLGLTQLEPLRTYAAGSTAGPMGGGAGGPTTGPYSIDRVRAAAVAAAEHVGDHGLAHELQEVCCWAPAAAAIRERSLAVQERGARFFFRDFPGGDQLAEVMHYTNNTSWRAPRFQFNPEHLVAQHYQSLQKSQSGIRTDVVTADRLQSAAVRGDLGLMIDRKTGERLSKAADRSEVMWAALSIFSGTLLDPSDALSRRLTPLLSLRRADDRALSRSASVTYTQVVLGAVQRAVWADMLDGDNAALPLVKLSAVGYLPLGEHEDRFVLLRPFGSSPIFGARTADV